MIAKLRALAARFRAHIDLGRRVAAAGIVSNPYEQIGEVISTATVTPVYRGGYRQRGPERPVGPPPNQGSTGKRDQTTKNVAAKRKTNAPKRRPKSRRKAAK